MQGNQREKTARSGKYTKRALAILLAIVFVFTTLPIMSMAATTSDEGGSGSEAGVTQLGNEQLTELPENTNEGGAANSELNSGQTGGTDSVVAVASVPDRIADEITLDKASPTEENTFEIAATDADSILQVKIDDTYLLPVNPGDTIEDSDIQWSTKDTDKLVLAGSVVEGLAVGSYTLTLTFAEGEEATELKIEDSTPADFSEDDENGIAPLAQTDSNSSLTMSVLVGNNSVDVDTIGNVVDWENADDTKQIKIKAEFSGTGDRSILVTVPLGYRIVEYSYGGTDSSQPASPSGVDTIGLGDDSVKVYSSVLTALEGTDWAAQAITGYTRNLYDYERDERTYAGKVLYTFNSNCDEITLTLTLGVQQSILSHANTETLLDKVTAELFRGGTEPTLTTGVAARITDIVPITGTVPNTVAVEIQDYPDNTTGTFYSYVSTYIYSFVSGAGQTHLVDSFTRTISYPEGVTFTGFKDTNLSVTDTNAPTGGSYAEDSTNTYYHMVVENDPVNRVVTVTYTNVRLAHGNGFYSYWEVDVDQTAAVTSPGSWDGSDINLSFPCKTSSTTGSHVGNTQTDVRDVSTMTAKVQPAAWDLQFMARGATRWNYNNTNDYPYDYMLGGFSIYNKGPSLATDLTYEWTFSPNLAVRAVTIPGSSSNPVTAVVARVSDKDGNERNIDVAGSFTGDSVNVILLSATAFGLEDDEYILTLKAEQAELFVGTESSPGKYVSSTGNYYGRFQNESSGAATLKISSSANGYSKTVIDSTAIGWDRAGAGTVATVATSYDTETETWGTGTWYPSSALQFTSTYNANSAGYINNSNEVVDPTIIISLPEGITLDTSSVQALSRAGNHESDRFDLRLARVEMGVSDASTGITWNIYHFTSVNTYDMIARERTGFQGSNHTTISVYFDATVSSACGVLSLNAQDVVQWDLGRSATNAIPAASYTVLDSLNRLGRVDTSTNYYLVAAITGQFFVAQKPGLSVSLGIRNAANTTESFYTYDGTSATIASLSAGGEAEIELSFANTSGDEYKEKSEIYLPIPKKDVAYSGIFNNVASDPYSSTDPRDSEFDLMLTGPISLPGFKTLYTFDTTGAANDVDDAFENNSWVPVDSTWLEEGDLNVTDYAKVTMVKFVATQNIVTADVANAGGGISTGTTRFTVAVSDTATLAQQNFWRSYQKGWRADSGAGTWIYGSVLAAETAKEGVIGKIFNDANGNGIMDSGDSAYDNTDGKVTALLTGTTILPVTLTVAADGSVSTPEGYSLRTGVYTISVTNADSLVDFTGVSATGAQRSDGTTWYMDIQQDDIISSTNTGTFEFEVDASSDLYPEYFGVGLTTKPVITYTAGIGVGNLSDTKVSVKYGATATGAPTLTANNAVTGYDFTTERWSFTEQVTLNDPSGGGTSTVAAGTKLTRAELYRVVVTKNLTATVSLSLSEYDISYAYTDNNGNNIIPHNAPSLANYGSTDVAFGTEDIGVEAEPVMEGYTFTGWSTGDVTVAQDGTFTMPNNDVTFTGYWTINTHDITYSYVDNPTTGFSAPAAALALISGYGADDVDYDTEDIAVEAKPALIGYTFYGWTTTDVNVSTSANTFTMPDKDVAFTGYWALDTYNITYKDLYGAANTNPATYTVESTDIVMSDAGSRAGYTFTGWNIAEDTQANGTDPVDISVTGNDAKGATLESGSYGHVIATALWTPIDYDVTYVGNGNTSGTAPAKQSVAFGKTFTVKDAGNLARTGYTFAGWNTAANGSGTSYPVGQVATLTTVGGLTLYAQWDPAGAGYTIYHHRVDADGNVTATETEARTGITGQTATAAARNYAPSHTFNASYPGTVASAVIAQDGSTALHLYYPVNTYTVTFVNWNGATLASRTNIPYGGGTTAPADPVRTGYTFTGWDRGYTNVTSNITVTAQYRINTFTVTFLGYDDVVLQTSTVNYGASVTPPANPTRTGFTFAGWDRPSSVWTNVTANATIRATWDAVVVPPEDDPEPPVTPPTETEVIDTEQEEQGLGSTIPILPGGVPLFGSEGTLSWALLNLILSLVGVALAVILAIVWRRRHKKYSEEDEEHRARLEREGYELEEEEDADRKHTRKLWLIVSMILAIAGVVFFLITEDMSQPMVMLDRWTIGNAIILIIEIIAYRLTLKKPKAYEDEDGQEEPVSV